MTNSGGGQRPEPSRWERITSGLSGHGNSGRSGHSARGYWKGGFRQRRKSLGVALLGVALVALVVAGAVSGIRALSGGEAVASNDSSGQSSQEQQLASSQDTSQKSGGSSPEATSAQNKDAENKNAGQPTAGMEKLGQFETDYRYSDSEARKKNLRLSSGAVNGTVLKPGETFSMNDHIEGLNYEKAKVFADGGETSALGGGLCQVTSTVYMAAQYAGLDIVERNAHYTILPYIRPGFDATVWFGGQGIPELDMKFKNTTGSNILLREYITDKGILKAEVWGQPNGKEVKMRSEEDFKDTSVGIKWSTYKTVEEDGKVVKEGVLHEDLYSYPPPEAGTKGYNDVRVGGWQ